MDSGNLYGIHNSESVISMEGIALLLNLPVEVIQAEYDRQGAKESGAMSMPKSWVKRGIRVRKEVTAALGYEPTLQEVIDYRAVKRLK